jgi:hypothetical protein
LSDIGDVLTAEPIIRPELGLNGAVDASTALADVQAFVSEQATALRTPSALYKRLLAKIEALLLRILTPKARPPLPENFGPVNIRPLPNGKYVTMPPELRWNPNWRPIIPTQPGKGAIQAPSGDALAIYHSGKLMAWEPAHHIGFDGNMMAWRYLPDHALAPWGFPYGVGPGIEYAPPPFGVGAYRVIGKRASPELRNASLPDTHAGFQSYSEEDDHYILYFGPWAIHATNATLGPEMRKMIAEGRGTGGTLVEVEQFRTHDLESTTADGSSLYDQININSTSLFVSNDPSEAVASLEQAGFLPEQNKITTRLSPSFSIHPVAASGGILDSEIQLPVVWDLGSRIQRRLLREDGTSMSLQEVLLFFNHNMPAIVAYLENLRKPDSSFRHKYIPLPPESVERNFKVSTHVSQFRPWHAILGDVKFTGLKSKGPAGREMPQMRWQMASAKPEDGSDNLHGRDTKHLKQTHAAAAHHIMNTMGTLEALGLVAPNQGRKRSSGWELEHDENAFVVKMDRNHFSNDIKQQVCGIDNYTGDQTKNIQACHDILDDTMESITAKLRRSLAMTHDLENWQHGAPSPWAESVAKRFSSFEPLVAALGLQTHRASSESKMFEKLKNGLVSKAYADEKCYNRCTKGGAGFEWSTSQVHHFSDGVRCRAGCYDPTEQRFEDLYGLSSKSAAAEKAPWHLNETNIVALSWLAYEQRSGEGFLPGSLDLNPFGDNFRDHSPILPTCFSEFQNIPQEFAHHKGVSHVPCTCGNKYGNESMLFWAASDWSGGDKHYERNMLKDCVKDDYMKAMAYNDPAAYLVNMCQLHYHAFAPQGSYLFQHNRGHWRENQIMCERAVAYYKDHEHYDDATLNDKICTIWAANADDFHRNLKADFSQVNSALNHGGCKGYKKRCHHHKGKTRCAGYPEGY